MFAADAVARLTGRPGVAAVTAGPGVTNTITAVKNAQLAQSPVVILGGATGTVLKGRGSLQDIDQLALFQPHVKWSTTVGRVVDLDQAVANALRVALSGVPGPVFVETPVDLLYDEPLVRDLYGVKAEGDGGGWKGRVLQWYLRRHVDRLFAGADGSRPAGAATWPPVPVARTGVDRVARALSASDRPVLMVGSQATLEAAEIDRLADAVGRLGVPVYLSGMARGLLGRDHPLQMRHRRRSALARADLVMLAGVPCDFRLDYGRQISGRAKLVSINRDRIDLKKNRKPQVGVLGDPGRFLRELAEHVVEAPDRSAWLGELRDNDAAREAEIDEMAAPAGEFVNPLELCRAIDRALPDDSVLVADGGDFVATASYVTAPRRPLSWLDPGVFGTLGVGGGFALGARLCRPGAEVWILYGDGSAAYSLAEFDTYVRHSLPVIAVVGNDASWAQIARDQVDLLGDDVGTVLRRTDYHVVAEGYGGRGFLIERPDQIEDTLRQAQAAAAEGSPVLINVLLGRSDFRKGSLSM